MKLSIWKYFSKILLRNFHQFQGLSLSYSRPGHFGAIPSICNQRSLEHWRIILAKGQLDTIHYDSAPRPKRSCFSNPTVHANLSHLGHIPVSQKQNYWEHIIATHELIRKSDFGTTQPSWMNSAQRSEGHFWFIFKNDF